MFSWDELNELVLKGYFQEGHDEQSRGQKHDYSVKLVHYCAHTGALVGVGSDEYGESALVGKIMSVLDKKGNVLKKLPILFDKIYLDWPQHFPTHVYGTPETIPYELKANSLQFRSVSYKGVIYRKDGLIVCRGEYLPRCHTNSGKWKLAAAPKRMH